MSAPRAAMFTQRRAGVLLHLSSLPGGHGIGDLGDEAHAFADWCARAGFTIWQMLPIGPVGPGNSPYASTSSFAGEALYISLDRLREDGLLARKDVAGGPAAGLKVNYAAARAFKLRRLRTAYETWHNRRGHRRRAFTTWCHRQQHWLPAWCAFTGDPDAEFQAFVQWIFDRQWRELRRHCAARGVHLLGDVPIFVPLHSADVRQHPELFRLDSRGRPEVVTGVPPDCFSRTGQWWGHPHYRWSAHERTGFAWWKARVACALQRFDAVRIDHFVGFVHAYEISARARTARHGVWRRAPGAQLLRALRENWDPLPLVAEDLGAVTPAVTALRRRFGLPGMRLVQNAFDAPESPDLPCRHPVQCVAYPGTHDNDTTAGWWRKLSPEARARFTAYAVHRAGWTGRLTARDVPAAMWRLVLGSPASTAMLPMQDLLGLGSTARMNTPGRAHGQWRWRMGPNALRIASAASIRALVTASARA